MIDLSTLPDDPPQRAALIEVADAARRVTLAESELLQQRLRLVAAIETAHGEGLSLATIAGFAGLTKGRSPARGGVGSRKCRTSRRVVVVGTLDQLAALITGVVARPIPPQALSRHLALLLQRAGNGGPRLRVVCVSVVPGDFDRQLGVPRTGTARPLRPGDAAGSWRNQQRDIRNEQSQYRGGPLS